MGRGKPIYIDCSYTREIRCQCGWQCEGQNNRAYLMYKLHSKKCELCELSFVPKEGYNQNKQVDMKYAKVDRRSIQPIISTVYADGEPIEFSQKV